MIKFELLLYFQLHLKVASISVFGLANDIGNIFTALYIFKNYFTYYNICKFIFIS